MTSPAGPGGKAGADLPRLDPGSRAAWRAWLAANHATSGSVWLVLPKKGSGLPLFTYSEARDEALCFGWIDSLPRKLDERRSLILMARRKPGSAWSKVNRDALARLEAEGLIAEPGRAMIAAAKADGSWTRLDAVEALEVPADLAVAFAERPGAAEAFEAFPRSVKRGILEWISTAKKPETRAQRVVETADKAARGERANQWRP